jgi:predicted Rossmann fold nucleotide-binding protein DprA/Smf involved in DNA uptake
MAEYILVAGSRNFVNAERLAEILAENVGADDTIVEGGAKGVDAMARQWAEARDISVVEIRADWAKYGRAAGPKRNDAMTAFIAEHGGRAVFIWDGESKGTKQCILSARKAGIENIRVYQEK